MKTIFYLYGISRNLQARCSCLSLFPPVFIKIGIIKWRRVNFLLDFAHPDVYYETLETYFVIELEKMLLVSRTLGTGGLEYAQTSKLDQAGFFSEPSVLGHAIFG